MGRARGDFKPGSDLDLATHAPKMPAAEFARLVWEIEDLPIAVKIDTIRLDELSDSPMKRNVIEESVAIWP